MSTFLPSPGKNLILLSSDRLKKAFNDVREGENGAIVLLSKHENLTFSGTCLLYALHSTITLLGTTLLPSPTPHPIYAPTNHPLPVVAPHPTSPAQTNSVSDLLTALGVERSRLEGFEAAVLVREGRSGLEGMGRVVPNFESVWTGDMAGWGVQGFYPILHQTSLTAHVVPPSWSTALTQSVPSPSTSHSQTEDASADDEDEEDETDTLRPFTALVKGPKRAGKSGFSRVLANRLLETYTRVAFLETDLGQSEFGPEGSVDLVVIEKPLFGPPFTHPAIPFRAHYMGSSSPRHNPTRYLALIQDLLSTYLLSIQYPPFSTPLAEDNGRNTSVVPLIVNTQGWVKGLGMDLLVRLERLVQPTHLFEFDLGDEGEETGWDAAIPAQGGWRRFTEDADEEEEEDQGWQATVKRHVLSHVRPSPIAARYGAVDLRILSLISYFHARFPSPSALLTPAGDAVQGSVLATRWDFSVPLVAQRPWAVDWTKALRRIYLVGPGAEEVDEGEVWHALGGCVVGLVQSTEHSSTEVVESTPRLYIQGDCLPDPSSTQYVGLGILRSVPSPDALPTSQTSKTIHLLCPLPPSVLPSAKILMRGETELPVCAMVNWKEPDGEGKDVPFLDYTVRLGMDIVGSDRRKVRRNVQRRT